VASLMENLIDVLEKESSEYEVLLGLSQKKTPIIVSGNLEELQKITDDEQEVVGRIANLEKKREEYTTDIANVLNKDVTTLRLTDLIALLSKRPVEQKALAIAHDNLSAAVQGLKRVNEQNKELLANALEMIEFEMNLMQSMKAAPEAANYNRGAYNTGNTIGVNAGRFDAKQ